MSRRSPLPLPVAPEDATGGVTRWPRRLWPAWITADLRQVLLARSLMSATRALAGVTVPIYLAVIGFSGLQLGLLFSIVGITSAVLSAIIGFTSDRVGRKIFLVVIPLLTAAGCVVFAFTRDPVVIVASAAAGSFGRGAGAGAGEIGPYQPAESALLADAVEPVHRNALFGRVAFMSALGALVGGGLLATLPDVLPRLVHSVSTLAAYRVVFLAMALSALLAGLAVLPISERKPTRRATTERQARPALAAELVAAVALVDHEFAERSCRRILWPVHHLLVLSPL